MMRVVLAHNFYRSSAPSGEDAVFREESSMLESAGFDVHTYERHSDELASAGSLRLARTAWDAIWSKRAYEDMHRLIARLRPDVVHFHNTFPLISPSAYEACHRAGVAVVQTLHNFRLICPGALLFRQGQPCELCVGGALTHAVRHGCYRNSAFATAAVAGMLQLNRALGTYDSRIDCYIALTQFAREKFIAGGLPAERIEIKRNALSNPPVHTGNGAGGYLAYAGRLSAEKGVHVLLEAMEQVGGPPLHIYGDGPLRPALEARAAERSLNVRFFGQIDRIELQRALGAAIALIAPSLWFEGLPMVVVEAYAQGTPVIASRIGSLEEIVRDGATGKLFAPGNSAALARAITDFAQQDARTIGDMRRAARAKFDSEFSCRASVTKLQEIYNRARSDASDRALNQRGAR